MWEDCHYEGEVGKTKHGEIVPNGQGVLTTPKGTRVEGYFEDYWRIKKATAFFANGDRREYDYFDWRFGACGLYIPVSGEPKYFYNAGAGVTKIDSTPQMFRVQKTLEMPELRMRFTTDDMHNCYKDEREARERGLLYLFSGIGVLESDLGYKFFGWFRESKLVHFRATSHGHFVNKQGICCLIYGNGLEYHGLQLREKEDIESMRKFAREHRGTEPIIIDPRQLLGISMLEPSDGSDFSLKIGRVRIDESFVASRLEDDRTALEERIKVFTRQT